MTTIRVVAMVGPVCVTREDGVVVGQAARAVLVGRDDVDLDFAEVQTVTSSFLHAALDRLFAGDSPGSLEGSVSWSGLDEIDDRLLRLVWKNIARFHDATTDQQAAMVVALDRMFED